MRRVCVAITVTPPLLSSSCATAYILLAEEEATTIMEAERLFKQALKAGEGCYRRSQQLQHHSTQYEAQHSESSARDTPARPAQAPASTAGFLSPAPPPPPPCPVAIGGNRSAALLRPVCPEGSTPAAVRKA